MKKEPTKLCPTSWDPIYNHQAYYINGIIYTHRSPTFSRMERLKTYLIETELTELRSKKVRRKLSIIM